MKKVLIVLLSFFITFTSTLQSAIVYADDGEPQQNEPEVSEGYELAASIYKDGDVYKVEVGEDIAEKGPTAKVNTDFIGANVTYNGNPVDSTISNGVVSFVTENAGTYVVSGVQAGEPVPSISNVVIKYSDFNAENRVIYLDYRQIYEWIENEKTYVWDFPWDESSQEQKECYWDFSSHIEDEGFDFEIEYMAEDGTHLLNKDDCYIYNVDGQHALLATPTEIPNDENEYIIIQSYGQSIDIRANQIVDAWVEIDGENYHYTLNEDLSNDDYHGDTYVLDSNADLNKIDSETMLHIKYKVQIDDENEEIVEGLFMAKDGQIRTVYDSYSYQGICLYCLDDSYNYELRFATNIIKQIENAKIVYTLNNEQHEIELLSHRQDNDILVWDIVWERLNDHSEEYDSEYANKVQEFLDNVWVDGSDYHVEFNVYGEEPITIEKNQFTWQNFLGYHALAKEVRTAELGWNFFVVANDDRRSLMFTYDQFVRAEIRIDDNTIYEYVLDEEHSNDNYATFILDEDGLDYVINNNPAITIVYKVNNQEMFYDRDWFESNTGKHFVDDNHFYYGNSVFCTNNGNSNFEIRFTTNGIEEAIDHMYAVSCWKDWETEEMHYEEMVDSIEGRLKEGRDYVFYYGKGINFDNDILLENIESSDNDAVHLEFEDGRYMLSFDKLGSYTLNVNINGNDYSIDVNVDYPQYALFECESETNIVRYENKLVNTIESTSGRTLYLIWDQNTEPVMDIDMRVGDEGGEQLDEAKYSLDMSNVENGYIKVVFNSFEKEQSLVLRIMVGDDPSNLYDKANIYLNWDWERAQSDEIVVSQDTDDGDIIITPSQGTDTYFLYQLMNGNGHIEIFGSDYSTATLFVENEDCQSNQSYKVVTNNDVPQYVLIDKDALLAANIPSGDVKFILYIYPDFELDYEDMRYQRTHANTIACEPFVGTVNIEQIDNKLVISADGEKAADFLKALAKPQEEGYKTDIEKFVNNIGGHVEIGYSCIQNIERFDVDCDFVDKYLEYNEDSNTITIYEDALYREHVFKSDENKDVRFYAYGYPMIPAEIGPITIGCTYIEDDFVDNLSVQQEQNGDITISFKEGYEPNEIQNLWLENLATPRYYRDCGENISEGSSICFVRDASIDDFSGDENRIWLSNQILVFGDGEEGKGEIQYRFENGKIVIPYDSVLEQNFVERDSFDLIKLFSIGYNEIQIRYEDDAFIIEKGCTTIPTILDPYEDENGNIVIKYNGETEDDEIKWNEWAMSLVSYDKNDNDNGFFGSYIRMQMSEDSDTTILLCNSFDSNGTHYEQLIYDQENKQVYVKNNTLLFYHVGNGNRGLEIKVNGYLQSEPYVVELNHASKPAPSGITAEQNSNGDLVITKAYEPISQEDNRTWLQLLAEGDIPEGEDNIIYSELRFDYDNLNYWMQLNPNDQSLEYEYNHVENSDIETLTISNDTLINYEIVNGTPYLYMNVYGYETAKLDEGFVEINVNAKEYPSDVRVTLTEENGLVIESEDTEYIDALCIASEGHEVGEDVQGSFINLYGENEWNIFGNQDIYIRDITGEELKWQSEKIISKSNDNTVTISVDDLLARKIVKGKEYKLRLDAKGYYHNYINDVLVPTFGVSDNLPSDIEVTYEPETGLVIKSNNSTWLKNIANINSTSKNQKNSMIQLYSVKNDFTLTFANTSDSKYEIRTGKGYVYVPASLIWNVGVINNEYELKGNYEVIISSDGYVDYFVEESINIETKEVNSDIEIYQGDNCIIIDSKNKDFLQALTESTTRTGLDKHVDQYGSEIFLMNMSNGGQSFWLTNGDGVNFVTYDKNADVVKVDYQLFEQKFYEFENGNYSSSLAALGYEKVTIPTRFKLQHVETTYDKDNIPVGSNVQLTFGNFEDITWNIEKGKEAYATVDENGIVKSLKVGKVKVYATTTVTKGDEPNTKEVIVSDYIELNIVKADVSLINNTGDVVTLKAEDGFTTTSQLTINLANEVIDDMYEYQFESLDTNIAEVNENGLVTFKAAGKVTINAYVLDKTLSKTYTIYSYDKDRVLTVDVEAVDLENTSKFDRNLIEVQDTFKVIGKVDGELVDAKWLTFKSSNENIVSIGENGRVEAKAAGKATITITLTGDPKTTRKATYTIIVVDRIAKVGETSAHLFDTTGSITSQSFEGNVQNEYIDYGKYVESIKTSTMMDPKFMQINLESTDKLGRPFEPTKVTYTSSDTAVATVDSRGTVVFKKAGQVTVNCKIASNPVGQEESVDIILRAISYEPKIESTKISYNRNLEEYPTINVYPVEGSAIIDCKISDTGAVDSSTNEVEESELFEMSTTNGELITLDNKPIIKLKDNQLKNKSYVEYLMFKVNDNWYKYKVSIVLTSSLPNVAIKASGNYNGITNENTLNVNVTSKDGIINEIVLIKDGEQIGTVDKDTGEVTLNDIPSSADDLKKVHVDVDFDGYNVYAYKEVTFAYSLTAPSIKLGTTSTSLYYGDGSNKTIQIQLIDNKKNPISAPSGTVIGLATNNEILCEPSLDESTGMITLSNIEPNFKKGKIALTYKEDGWNQAINLPVINVSVVTTTPSAKLSASSINLNTKYHNSDEVTLSCSSPSELVSIDESEIEVTAPKGGNSECIKVENNADGTISISLDDTNTIVNGNYKITLKPFIEANGRIYLKNISLNVKVDDNDPTLNIKTKTIKFNNKYNETVTIPYSLSKNNYDSHLTGISIVGDENIAEITYNNENIVVKYLGDETISGNHKYEIYPKFYVGEDKDPVEITVPTVITVNVYGGKEAKASISVKGTLNQIDLNTEVIGTVKFSNLVATIEDIIDIDDDRFVASVNDEGNIVFKLNDSNENVVNSSGEAVMLDGSYKVPLTIKTDAGNVDLIATIKVQRKAPTLKLSSTVMNVYETTVKGREIGTVELEITGVNATIRDVSINLVPAYEVTWDGTNKITVTLKDGARLKSGSTNKFTIKVTWNGDYADNSKGMKTSTVSLSVKDCSNSISITK